MSEFTTTPNYGLEKPEVNADSDQWGARLNANSDTIDAVMKANETAAGAALPLAGGTLTGPLALAADPTLPAQAANKHYVDTHALPLTGGTLTGALALAADPTTALQAATRQYVDNHPPLGGPFLPLAGGALTGPLALAADPTTALQAATKEYTDAGDAAIAARAADNTGRNLVHNSMFRVAQRGTGPFSGSAYTADRWSTARGTGGGTCSVTVSTFADAGRAQVGDESAQNQLTYVFTGGAAAGDQDVLVQKIEGVRRTANQTVTASFWAASTGAALKLGINASQNFGAGGSPSATVSALSSGIVLSLPSGGWNRYTATFAMPSVQGKTFGTAGNDWTAIYIYLSAGSAANPTSGGIGVQSGQVSFWGMQLEIGSVATPLEKIDIQQDLAKCQRFYAAGQINLASYSAAGSGIQAQLSLPGMMRAAPTITPTFTLQTNCSGANLVGQGAGGAGYQMLLTATVTALGAYQIAGSFTASADL
jgi:hypothetical protein